MIDAGFTSKKALNPSQKNFAILSVFIRNKAVDTESFAKFFLAGFRAFFDLKPASIKVFNYILGQLKLNQDSFMFFMNECKEETGY